MDNIIGREGEKRLLNEVMDSHEPEFLAIYGRRRDEFQTGFSQPSSPLRGAPERP